MLHLSIYVITQKYWNLLRSLDSTQDVNCRGNTAMAKDERKIRRTRSERGFQKEDLLDHGVTHQLLLQK
jgi:hypothetical protein